MVKSNEFFSIISFNFFTGFCFVLLIVGIRSGLLDVGIRSGLLAAGGLSKSINFFISIAKRGVILFIFGSGGK